MEFDVLFASVPTADLRRSAAWYSLLFGRPPDITPNEQEEMWRVADGGWLYLIDDLERAGHTTVSIAVTDLDATVGLLEGAGLEIASRETVGEAGRKAWLVDPDGNSVALLEVA